MTSARTPRDREEAARERWHAGQPARNAFERDTYAVLEHDAAAGMNRLERQGKQAAAMEAAMTKEAADQEAGSVSTITGRRRPPGMTSRLPMPRSGTPWRSPGSALPGPSEAFDRAAANASQPGPSRGSGRRARKPEAEAGR